MQPIVSITDVSKTYATGFQALKNVSLDIRKGEIFALLGPNGAGKTTLINIICGIVRASTGRILADGHDIVSDYRQARFKIGLVPQELTTDAFETVWATASHSRGLFGRGHNPAYIEKVLKDLSLWDKKDSKIMTLSGGMKRRVMIAKALSHEPSILFLDEPSAGVDVELRRDMWNLVRSLARQRRDHHPHHALYRGSRRDGRPGRRHQQRRDHPGRGEEGLDAQARQEADHARAYQTSEQGAGPACVITSSSFPPTVMSSPTAMTRKAAAPASRPCCTISPKPTFASAISTPSRARSKISSSIW